MEVLEEVQVQQCIDDIKVLAKFRKENKRPGEARGDYRNNPIYKTAYRRLQEVVRDKKLVSAIDKAIVNQAAPSSSTTANRPLTVGDLLQTHWDNFKSRYSGVVR